MLKKISQLIKKVLQCNLEGIMMKIEHDYLPGARPYSPKQIQEYTEKGYWLNETYEDLLQRAVKKFPSKTFIVDLTKKPALRLTFKEAKEKIDRFAAYLKKQGVKKYDRILVQLPNCYEFIITYFGAQKIGAVPVLAVPKYEYLEINDIMTLTQPVSWIIPDRDGARDFVSLIPKIKANHENLTHIFMIGDHQRFPEEALSLEECIEEVTKQEIKQVYHEKPDPNDVAHILLTGGTTGRSKAVPRTYNSFLTNVRYINRHFSSEDINLLATPVGHGMAHQGALGCSVLHGGTLIISASPRPTDILEAIHTEKVTRLAVVPTQLIGMLEHPELEKYDLSSLRMISTAGAPLDSKIAQRAIKFFSQFECIVQGGAYGSSEGPSAQHPEPPTGTLVASVGKPLVDGDHYIVINEQEEILPPNTIGELAVKGPSVFTVYYNSEEVNDQIFTKSGYYKTGDLAKIDENGYIYITGRKKDIIQRGGESIVPSEIEDLIEQHPAVDKAAVVGMPDPYMGERACAYVTLKSGIKSLTLEDMIRFLKEKGAGVLLWPERLEIIEEFPLTNVGKLDKKALRKSIREKLIREGVICEKEDL
jgi:2,3-dihydroxybenzoate-AMP ligase